jgi:hypothetical protein
MQNINNNTAVIPAVQAQTAQMGHNIEGLTLDARGMQLPLFSNAGSSTLITPLDKLRKEIITWMSPINFFVTQKDILSRYQQGTCEAVLESPELKAWMRELGAKLLCSGIRWSCPLVPTNLPTLTYCSWFRQDDLLVRQIRSMTSRLCTLR